MYEEAEYTPNAINQILASIKRMQKYTNGCKITKEDIRCALKQVEARPYGEIEISAISDTDFGEKRIMLYIYWYSWRRKKRLKWSVLYSYPSSDEKLPANVSIVLQNITKVSVWDTVFPERYRRYIDLCFYRQLRQRGYVLPPDIENIVAIDEKYGMILIQCTRYGEHGCMYLCSPLGYAEMSYYIGSVYSAAMSIGVRIPRNKEKRIWENIEPAWVMTQLKKL